MAIGAPKEDDFSGAVYIYHGDAGGMVPQYSMVIGVRVLWFSTHSFHKVWETFTQCHIWVNTIHDIVPAFPFPQ